jgi:hypothetical protein
MGCRPARPDRRHLAPSRAIQCPAASERRGPPRAVHERHFLLAAGLRASAIAALDFSFSKREARAAIPDAQSMPPEHRAIQDQ